jgi:cytochrome c-type biogenesis protein CcmH
MLTRILGFFLLIATSFVVIDIADASPVETFEFQDEVTKVRFQALSKELRCPKCQNQNLADSNSTVASALRLELYNLLIQGRADSEIIDLMVGRYGEFVLYRPRVSSVTYILWFGPVLLILIGIIVVIVILRKKPATQENLVLDSQQQEKLKQLLYPEQVQPNNPNVTKQKKES